MAVRIRLARTGKKNQPSYRIVAADSRTKRDGKVLENLGFYDPKTEPPTVRIKRDRFDYWLSVGAQPSDPVRALILGQKRMRTKVKKEKKEVVKEEKPMAAEEQKKVEAQKEKPVTPQKLGRKKWQRGSKQEKS